MIWRSRTAVSFDFSIEKSLRFPMLLLVLCSAGGMAQQPQSQTFSVPETKSSAASTNEFGDAWPGIATATNEWAAAIQKMDGWDEVLRSTLTEARTQAEKGVAVAQLKLGYSYFAGDAVERDFSAASQWLLKAAASHLAPAEFLLGIAYLNGLGVAQDFRQAVDWLDRAAEQGFADAEFQVGLCYLRGGPGVNQAPARGVKWLLRAAEQGKPNAQQFVAWCFASGNGVKEDPPAALAWSRKAAEQGLESAQDFLGMFYATGYGTNQDWAEAVKWFRRAADQGLGTAQMHLAQCYDSGRGTAKDAAQALRWWREAARQGYPGAQFHTGLHRFEGTGVSQDMAAAFDWFQKAAEQKHIGGQLFLGLCFWKGLGVNTDAEAAQKWWREAAVHGISLRLPEMGDDVVDVEKWWQQVAEQGNARIQCSLAEFYRFGQGVAQSDAQALKWYRKAAATGDVSALQAAAWLLSTSPKTGLRDGRSAVDFAKKVVAATKRKVPKALDVLAAAYAESAQFGKALSAEQEAILLAQDDDEKKEYQARLKLYQAKMPYRTLEDPPQSPALE
jgi:TPR repeat protein